MNEPQNSDAFRMRALQSDNERQRRLTIEAHERALNLAKRCDKLEAELMRDTKRQSWFSLFRKKVRKSDPG